MEADFAACGVVTVTTDFGHRGPFVGAMKGVILQRFAAARIVDLTHEVFVHWPAEAGFWLERSYHYFPPGTVHLAVVDPGVGTDRDILVVGGKGHLFVGPDNGLLGSLCERLDASAYRIDDTVLARIGVKTPSATFHGRDLFAPLAAELATGRLTLTHLGTPTDNYIPSLIEQPVWLGRHLQGQVITIDHFGNLITNVESTDLDGLSAPRVRAGGHTMNFYRTYGEVAPGELLALINSFGVVEIACAEQSAAQELHLGRGAPVVVIDGDET